MENLFRQTAILKHELKQDLLNFENAQDRPSEERTSQIVQEKFQRVRDCCDRLDILVNKEPPQTRAQARQNVNEIKYDLSHYEVRFDISSRSSSSED